MNAMLQIDRLGRVLLPKRLRDHFGLKRGDRLALLVRGDAIELRPTRTTARLERINGVLVLIGNAALPAGTDLTRESREARLRVLARFI